MLTSPFLLIAVAFMALLAVVSWRDHRILRDSRRGLLDRCRAVVEDGVVTHGADDFPRLDGRKSGRAFRAELVPDTMTIRRLPQLWLSLTLLESRPGLPSFAVLVRAAGTEFYSLTGSFDYRLEPPAGFPWEVLVRGSHPGAQALLDRVGPVAAAILADPKVKELAVTPKGLRLVWQAGEGRKGEHLLLRQAVFDNAEVPPEALEALFSKLETLSQATGEAVKARAA